MALILKATFGSPLVFLCGLYRYNATAELVCCAVVTLLYLFSRCSLLSPIFYLLTLPLGPIVPAVSVILNGVNDLRSKRTVQMPATLEILELHFVATACRYQIKFLTCSRIFRLRQRNNWCPHSKGRKV